MLGKSRPYSFVCAPHHERPRSSGEQRGNTAPQDASSEAAFWIVLATIVVGTVLSVTFGILAAVGGLPDLHQRWMLLCYGGDQAGEHDSPLLTGAPLSPATPP